MRATIDHRWHGHAELVPLERDEFRTERGLRIRFDRNDVSVVTGFYATANRTRNVWFQKQD